jgi:phosphoesterase RecJ-like protein
VTTIPEQLLKQIQEASSVVLFTHTHPDGDAYGSLFGLASILEALGKKVFCFFEEPVSHLYDFLPEIERANSSLEEFRDFVSLAGDGLAAIALDCGDADRLGEFKDQFLKISPFLVIDHHRSHRDFGTSRWVDVNSSSTGEMVYEIGTRLGADINHNCACNLYVALCTDTGSFRYECTGPRTMKIAGELLELGVKPEQIGSYLYDNFSPERLKLLEMVLGTIALSCQQQIACMHVTQDMLMKSGASMKDVEGFIDFPRSLKDVKVAALLKETNNGYTAVSLRAKGECNVAEVANRFDGGGHRNAAGFRCYGSDLEQVRSLVLPALQESVLC